MATLVRAPRRWGLPLMIFVLGSLTTQVGWAQAKASPRASGAASASPQPAPAEGPADAALGEAKLHFENGVALLQATPPNYQDAYRQFLLAYEKSGKRWSILGNLALCALNLERDGEALAYYEAYLREGQDQIDPAERASIEREMLLIKGNMATVELTSTEPGAQVSVRREGSSAPAQLYRLDQTQPDEVGAGATELGLRAGQLTITATAGEKTETWTVVLSAGDTKSHDFTFAADAPTPAPVAATTPAPTDAQPSSASPLRTVGFITGGVGIAALIGGVVTGVMTTQKEGEARDQCIGNICPEAAEDDFQAASDLALVTNVLLIGGGVLTATGVTLVIVGGKKQTRESARVELTPHASPFFAGLTARGTF